jgi:hypothetical protein
MRTKILLAAAAAMAAGVVASNAQVYSANVVGYANVVLPGNGGFNLVANPFDDGNGNQSTNILNSALPKKSQVLTWNGAGFNIIQKTATGWPSSVSLPPGVGFFVENGAVGSLAPDVTNTFVGSVVVLSGGSITNAEPLGTTLQGSPIPYAGNLAILNQNGGDANLDYGSPLTKKSQILTWNGTGYNIAQKTATSWGATSTVGVGQGFFINNVNGPATNMVQNASY